MIACDSRENNRVWQGYEDIAIAKALIASNSFEPSRSSSPRWTNSSNLRKKIFTTSNEFLESSEDAEWNSKPKLSWQAKPFKWKLIKSYLGSEKVERRSLVEILEFLRRQDEARTLSLREITQ